MMSKFEWMILALFFVPGLVWAQQEAPIQIEEGFFKQRYFEDSISLKLSDLISEMDGSGTSYDLIRKANNQHDLSRFCMFSGAFLALYPALNEALGRDPNYNMTIVGIALAGISVPLELSSRKNATKAVMMYNRRQSKTLQSALKVVVSGIGLSVHF